MSDVLDGVTRELRLEPDELLAITLMQQLMLGRDVIAEKDQARQQRKAELRDAFAAAAAGRWSRSADLPVWARESAVEIAGRVPAHQRSVIEAAAPVFGASVERRSRALLVLIELHGFEPWPAGLEWVARARRDALAAVARALPALRPGDAAAVTAEFAAVGRALGRRQVRWGRVAVVSAAGLALGVATAGAAAPLIGATVGGALGLSGASATSAGLAALGGGSLAAGGFGVAGGTALLTGLGALGGAGIGAAGSRVVGWNGTQVARQAVALDVITRLVVLDAEGDEEKARRVVLGLQARLDEVGEVLGRLAEQLRRLTAENARLSKENEELRHRLQLEQDEARLAEAALEIVIDRIPVGA